MKYLLILLPLYLNASQYTPDSEYNRTRRVSAIDTIYVDSVSTLNLPPPQMIVECDYTLNSRLLMRMVSLKKGEVWGIIIKDKDGYGITPWQSILGYRIK